MGTFRRAVGTDLPRERIRMKLVDIRVGIVLGDHLVTVAIGVDRGDPPSAPTRPPIRPPIGYLVPPSPGTRLS